VEGQQLGVMQLGDAIRAAQQNGVDLVEVAATANPPVCRLVDYGKFRYEQNKREKESKKHHHGGKLKEIQLSASIDPHDFKTKLQHAIEFLCEDMKVKVALRFRGREMAHTEFGFKVVKDFIQQTSSWGHADNEPRLQGRSINIMLNPLAKNRRAKNPYEQADAKPAPSAAATEQPAAKPADAPAAEAAPKQYSNNPFATLS
jgi:translation initiation factor IF-3